MPPVTIMYTQTANQNFMNFAIGLGDHQLLQSTPHTGWGTGLSVTIIIVNKMTTAPDQRKELQRDF